MRVRTPNFTVVGNAGESKMRALALQLEQFRKAISLLLPRTKIDTPVPTTVIVFRNYGSFRPYQPLYKGETQTEVAGYFTRGDDVNYIAMTSDVHGKTPYGLVFHEYEHFIVQNNLPNAPLWLNEGLAEYYSTFQPSSDGLNAQLGVPIDYYVTTLRESLFIPLNKLLTVGYDSPEYHERRRVGIFYAESWALVHYLILGNDGRRKEQFVRFMSRLDSGAPLEQIFRESFEADYRQIEVELGAYVLKRALPTLILGFSQQVVATGEAEAGPLSEAEAEYYLGDLLLRTGRVGEAEAHLRRSAELDPKLTASQVALGIVEIRHRRIPEAIALLKAAAARDPRDYLALYYLGRASFEAGRYGDAVEAIGRATGLNPERPQAYAVLGYALWGLGRDADAARAFEAYRRRDPANPGFYRERAYVGLRLARGEQAAEDARAYIRARGWADDHAASMALAGYFGYREAKNEEAAAKLLGEAAPRLDASEWPYPVLRYLRREQSADELFAAASSDEERTEAHAYVGLDLALAGDREAAISHLQWMRERGNKDSAEYALAVSELERLEGGAAR